MKISVVIPIYNVETFLRQALSSVVNQSYRNIDIVCVDDGSTDNSLSILKEYAAQDNRMQVIPQENQGTYIARQVGVNAAQGDYILFLDPDDWLELDACEKLSDFAKTSQADVIQYGAYIEPEKGWNDSAEWINKRLNPEIASLTGSDALMDAYYIERKIIWNMIGKMFKASIAKKAFSCQGRYRIIMLEDCIASFYICAFSQTYRSIPLKLYHYRHGLGLSSRKEITIENFERIAGSFQGLEDLERFVAEYPQLLNEKSIDIAKNIIRNHVIDDTFCYVNRLPRSTDAKQWYDILKQNGIGDEIVVKKVLSELSIAKNDVINYRSIVDGLEEIKKEQQAHIANLEVLIKNQQASIEEQHRCIEQQQVYIETSQTQLDCVSEKNKIHLKQVRTLAIIIGLMLLGLITSLIA